MWPSFENLLKMPSWETYISKSICEYLQLQENNNNKAKIYHRTLSTCGSNSFQDTWSYISRKQFVPLLFCIGEALNMLLHFHATDIQIYQVFSSYVVKDTQRHHFIQISNYKKLSGIHGNTICNTQIWEFIKSAKLGDQYLRQCLSGVLPSPGKTWYQSQNMPQNISDW